VQHRVIDNVLLFVILFKYTKEQNEGMIGETYIIGCREMNETPIHTPVLVSIIYFTPPAVSLD
jgi:hypothetical protein